MGNLYVLGITFIALLVILKIGSFLMKKELKDKINQALKAAINKFIFYGLINSILIGFIKMTISIKT